MNWALSLVIQTKNGQVHSRHGAMASQAFLRLGATTAFPSETHVGTLWLVGEGLGETQRAENTNACI